MKEAPVLMVLMAVLCSAEQFTLWDTDLVFDGNAWSGWQCPQRGGPSNWMSPVDYYHGTIYRRVAVSGKPSNLTMVLQQCYWQDPGLQETCEMCGISFSTTGEFFSKDSPASWWWNTAKGNPPDWSVFTTSGRSCIVLKETNCSGKWVDANAAEFCMGGNGMDVRPHVPVTMHYTAIVVSAGAEFSGWANYPVSGATSAQPMNEWVPQHDILPVRLERREAKAYVVASNLQPCRLTVFDLAGRQLAQQRITTNAETRLSLPERFSGPCFIAIHSGNSVIFRVRVLSTQ